MSPSSAGAQPIRVRVLMTLSTVEVELRGQRDPERAAEPRLRRGRRDRRWVRRPRGSRSRCDNALALQALRRGDHEQALSTLRRRGAARRGRAASTTPHPLPQPRQPPAATAAARPPPGAISIAASRWPRGRCRHREHELESLGSSWPGTTSATWSSWPATCRCRCEIMDEAAAMPVGVSLAISALDKAQGADRGRAERRRRPRAARRPGGVPPRPAAPGARRDRARPRRVRRPQRQPQGRAGARRLGSDPVQAAWQPPLAPGRRAVPACGRPRRRAAADPADRARLAADSTSSPSRA